MSDLTWTKKVEGRTYTVVAPEVSPGVVQIATDYLEHLMAEAGWTRVTSPASTPGGEP